MPEWAPFASDAEYSAFIAEVERYFKQLNIPIELDDGIVHTGENDKGFGKLGLMNVAQFCAQAQPKDYRALVAGHFNTLQRTTQFSNDFDKIASNFEAIKQYLAVRVHDKEYVRTIAEYSVGKPIGEGLFAALVFDFPDSVQNVTREQLEPWGKSIEELLEIGTKNVFDSDQISLKMENMGEFRAWLATSDSFFAANVIFELERWGYLVGSHGSLIGLPHRHAAFIYPIENLEVITAINGLIVMTRGMYDEGPGSLSQKLFWYHEGKFKIFPHEVEDGRLVIQPTEEFMEMLNALRE